MNSLDRNTRKSCISRKDTLGIQAMYSRKNTSLPNKEHRKYPYLLKGIKIDRKNQVWGCDITYIRLK
jgi:putative transposase